MQAIPLLRSLRSYVTGAVLVGAALSPQAARADFCAPPPTPVPGLPGAPSWSGPPPVRADLNEPRWAAGPLTPFTSDLTQNEGRFRLMTNAAGDRLYVSMQTSNEHGDPTPTDQVFFGISKDVGATNPVGTAVRIRVNPGAAPGGFVAANEFRVYSFLDNPPWTTEDMVVPPSWVIDPAVWSNAPGDGVDWGINFIVNLTELGIGPSDTFKVVLAMTIRDETNGNDSTIATLTPTNPSIGFQTQLMASNPANWKQTRATGSGCVGGIRLSSSGIRTNNASPHHIDTTPGHVNVFSAQPDYGAVGLFDNMLQAEFRIANWGSIADPNAGWIPIPNATGIPNQGPAGLIQFTCPSNTVAQTCGMAVPAQKHQCIQVRLNYGPGSNPDIAPITTASAYRNMDFVPLSSHERTAEISVKGLSAILGNEQDREVYLYVYPGNLPAHGNEQIFLATDRMAETKRQLLAPPPPPVQVRDPKGALEYIKTRQQRQLAASNGGRPGVATHVPQKPVADPNLAATQPSLVDPELALKQVWPHYEVRPYYHTGKTVNEDGKEYRALVAMHPFTLYYSHEGPLFGFSHQLELVEGGRLEELQAPTATKPGLYKLTIPNEGVARLKTAVEAHEKPQRERDAQETPADCPPCKVERKSHCNCSLPGLTAPLNPLLLASFGLGAAAWLRRRRRAS